MTADKTWILPHYLDVDRGWKRLHQLVYLAGVLAVVAACGTALVAVVAGMLVRNMTDVLWVRQNSLLYWGVVGVLLAWGEVRRKPAA